MYKIEFREIDTDNKTILSSTIIKPDYHVNNYYGLLYNQVMNYKVKDAFHLADIVDNKQTIVVLFYKDDICRGKHVIQYYEKLDKDFITTHQYNLLDKEHLSVTSNKRINNMLFNTWKDRKSKKVYKTITYLDIK